MNPKNLGLASSAVGFIVGGAAAINEISNPLHRVLAYVLVGLVVFGLGVYVDRHPAPQLPATPPEAK